MVVVVVVVVIIIVAVKGVAATVAAVVVIVIVMVDPIPVRGPLRSGLTSSAPFSSVHQAPASLFA